MGGIKCASCNRPVGRYDDYLQCSAGCLARHHAACVGITVTQLTTMKQSGEIKSWMCPKGCLLPEEGRQRSLSVDDGERPATGSRAAVADSAPCDRCSMMMDYFSQMVNKLEKKMSGELASFKNQVISEIKSVLGEKFTLIDNIQSRLEQGFQSHADDACNSRSLATEEKTVASRSYARAVATSVIIKPKDKQSNAVTKSDLLRNIDPVVSKVDFAKIKHIKDGGIFVGCSSKGAAEKLTKEAEDKLADKYTVREVKPINPRVRVVGMSERHEEDAFLSYLKMQNTQIFGDGSELKLVSFEPVKAKQNGGKRRSEVFQAVLQISAAAYNKILLAGQLFVGYDCCTVYDAVEITRCFNCCGYHHIANKCKANKPVCPRCSGNHLVKDCSSEVLKCVNCFTARDSIPDINFSHAAWDRGCVVFQQRLKEFKSDVLGLK